MKTSLQLRISQHLTMTPQLQQSIKLLQLSTVELNQEVERYLLENPLLERIDSNGGEVEDAAPYRPALDLGVAVATPVSDPGERPPEENDFSFGENSAFSGSNSRRENDDGDDDGEFAQIAAASPTLQESLINQQALLHLSERDHRLVLAVIAHLDDDGYLTIDLADLREAVSEHMETEEEELLIALRHVQNLEPTGVGARSLSECLALQLAAMRADTPGLAVAKQLVEQHLDVLAARDFAKLKRLLHLDDVHLKQVRELVLSLDPRPARGFGADDVRYVVPDVVVRKVSGRWRAYLNQEAMPRLRVNRLYADLLQKTRDPDGKNLSGQLQEARWLIKNVQQRFDTIVRVSQAIIDRQRHFFDHGEVAMKPLVLREIAEEVELHESTISRVTTQKYMLTPRGIYELKYFFGSSVSTDSGGECSATAIRALIRQLVEAEDPRKPLSDNRIADLLTQQGILVARRTIAKYREGMNIHPASQRKSL